MITIRQYKAGTKELIQEIVQKNLLMQSTGRGLDVIVQRLLSINTYSLNITKGAIGTGSTPPTVNDTQLVAETVRVSPSTTQDIGYNEAVLQFFFPDANLANGTYNEFGTFIDGAAGANTGQLFNRAIFASPYVKTAGTDTTVEVDITFTQ